MVGEFDMDDGLEHKIFGPPPPQQQSLSGDFAKFSFIQWLNVDDDILVKLETILRGYSYSMIIDKENSRFGFKIDETSKDRKPKCNDIGVRDIIYFLNMHLNKNVRMSNVDKGEVYRDIKEVAYDVNAFLYENWAQWELDLSFYDALFDILVYNIWFSYNRAKDEGERQQASRQYQETNVRQVVENKSEKQGGFFSRF